MDAHALARREPLNPYWAGGDRRNPCGGATTEPRSILGENRFKVVEAANGRCP